MGLTGAAGRVSAAVCELSLRRRGFRCKREDNSPMLNIAKSRAIFAAVAAASLLATSAAYAQTSPNQPELTLSQIESRLSGQGYRVYEIERDDGRYEVKARDSQGRCVELDVDRRSGEILYSHRDDDCGFDDSHRNRGGR